MTLTPYPTKLTIKEIMPDYAIVDRHITEIHTTTDGTTGTFGGWDKDLACNKNIQISLDKLRDVKLTEPQKRALRWAERMKNRNQFNVITEKYGVTSVSELTYHFLSQNASRRINKKIGTVIAGREKDSDNV